MTTTNTSETQEGSQGSEIRGVSHRKTQEESWLMVCPYLQVSLETGVQSDSVKTIKGGTRSRGSRLYLWRYRHVIEVVSVIRPSETHSSRPDPTPYSGSGSTWRSCTTHGNHPSRWPTVRVEEHSRSTGLLNPSLRRGWDLLSTISPLGDPPITGSTFPFRSIMRVRGSHPEGFLRVEHSLSDSPVLGSPWVPDMDQIESRDRVFLYV